MTAAGTVIPRPCVNTWEGALREREEMAVANPALYVWLEGHQEREREGTQIRLDLQWESQSDGSQVIGGKLLIGQLAPRVTWDI